MFDIDLPSLPSLEDLFNSELGQSCATYKVTAIDAEAGGELGDSDEPNPEKTQIVWAARSELIEIDHELKTATVKVWFS